MRPEDEPTATGRRTRRQPPDLRMPVLGLGAWGGGLAAHLAPTAVVLAVLGGWAAVLAVVALRAARRPGATLSAATGMGLGVLLAAAAVTGATLVRTAQVEAGPVAALAGDRAAVGLLATVSSDPRVVNGGFGDQAMVRLRVHHVEGRGQAWDLSSPVLVLGDPSWLDVPLGSTVRATGLLEPADGEGLAAILRAGRGPVVVEGPDVWWRGAERVRAALRDSVSHRPEDQRALVPALVDGDDSGVSPALADDFRATGLTHLLAVSGTNLTLVVGFLLVIARWCKVRGRWLYVVGACGIIGFVLLARTEPSVVRAAAMGSVALLALGSNGRQRALRALGLAVLALLLVDPDLAVSLGFALSVLATTGILVLAPGWRDALATWLPRWLAEAVAVPAAAQLACTPLVAAISGQVSIVAVAANLAVAPVVGPATVLGLSGGLVGLMWPAAARVLGTLACWCVAWVIAVARIGAGLPTAAVDWGTGALALVGLSVLTLAIALVAPVLLRRRSTGLACCLVMVLGVLVRPPTPGWPPAGWVIAACDVGQGDALALRAGPGTAVVVDAGPDPAAVDRCLDRLDVTRVPLVVLTHFHADHIDGLDGVLDGREVGEIATTRLLDPPGGVAEVAESAATAGVRAAPAAYGVVRTIGEVTLQVLWPRPDSPVQGPGDGSTANEASVVVLAQVRGVRILLTGDVEPEGQEALAAALPGLRVDVLKMPHHGSRYQDEDWLVSMGARLVLVSVGADNDYGHPASAALDPLADAGAQVLRTDLDGDLIVTEEDGELRSTSRGGAP